MNYVSFGNGFGGLNVFVGLYFDEIKMYLRLSTNSGLIFVVQNVQQKGDLVKMIIHF